MSSIKWQPTARKTHSTQQSSGEPVRTCINLRMRTGRDDRRDSERVSSETATMHWPPTTVMIRCIVSQMISMILCERDYSGMPLITLRTSLQFGSSSHLILPCTRNRIGFLIRKMFDQPAPIAAAVADSSILLFLRQETRTSTQGRHAARTPRCSVDDLRRT